MMSTETFRIGITITSGCLALVLNILLAGIILTTRCSYIGKYKWLLFLYTLSAALYAFTQICIAGSFFMSQDGYVFFDSLHFLPLPTAQLAVYLFVSCFIQNIIILSLSFFYRYYAVCNPEGLESFLRHYVRNGLLCLLILGVIMGGLIMAMHPSHYCQSVLEKSFFKADGYPLGETGHICGVVFVYDNLNWELLLGLGSFAVFITVSGVVIVTLALRIGRTLKESTSESETVARNQKKIFTLLIFQLSLPILFNIVPLQIVILSTYFQLPTEWLVHSLGATLSFAQVIDPVLIFYFIRPYRLAVREKILRKTVVRDQAVTMSTPGGYSIKGGNAFDSSNMCRPIKHVFLITVQAATRMLTMAPAPVVSTAGNIPVMKKKEEEESAAGKGQTYNGFRLERPKQRWKLFFSVSIGILAFVLFCSLYSCFPREEYYQENGAAFLALTGRDLNATAYNCDPVTLQGEVNWQVYWGLGQFTGYIFVCGAVNIYCSVKIALFLRNSFSQSNATVKKQTRIFALLLLQFLFPLIFNLIPVFLTFLAAYLHVPTFRLEVYVGTIVSFAQIIDPILIFIFISDYRKTVKGIFCRAKVYMDMSFVLTALQ